jgi:alpha-ribazole phosphatase
MQRNAVDDLRNDGGTDVERGMMGEGTMRACTGNAAGSAADRRVDLFLLRHGMTLWNVEQRYLGHTDVPLDPAHAAGLDCAKRLLRRMEFDAVYCSDLQRCRQTLAFVRPDLAAQFDSRLRELCFGDWEGGTYEQLAGNEAFRHWLDRWEELAPPNGESGADFRRRVWAFAADMETAWSREAEAPPRSVLVVAHGGSIRMLVSRYVAGLSPWEPQINHGGIVRLRLRQMCGESGAQRWASLSLDDMTAT